MRLLALVLASSPPKRRLPLELEVPPGTIKPRKGERKSDGAKGERDEGRCSPSLERKEGFRIEDFGAGGFWLVSSRGAGSGLPRLTSGSVE